MMPENMLIEAHYQGDRGINAVNKVKYSPLEHWYILTIGKINKLPTIA
ncbi:MAG: hypothetical protein GYA02_18405 [Clostridiaceae bacterium]|jgi:hypothetical protein|nr:hypothetical protein [Clostridiaceae bacterium]